eukprot:m51a1_g13376 hypothetical protein (72) ;mRNA; r:2054-2269
MSDPSKFLQGRWKEVNDALAAGDQGVEVYQPQAPGAPEAAAPAPSGEPFLQKLEAARDAYSREAGSVFFDS